MKKTCINCEHFHGFLGEGQCHYHIHNYCDKWNCAIRRSFESEVNKFLEQHWNDVKEAYDAKKSFEWEGIYDDFETGDAVCWMFCPKEAYDAEDFETNDRLDNNKELNRKAAIATIENILETEKIWNPYEECYNTLTDELDEEEIAKLRDLLLRLKNS